MENLIDKYLKEKMPATALIDEGHYKQILFNYEEWRQYQTLTTHDVSNCLHTYGSFTKGVEICTNKMKKEKFKKDFEYYKAKLQSKLDNDTVNLMLLAYCMGYCDMVNHVNEDVDGMYLVDPVLDKISELSPLVKHRFD